MRTTPNIGHLFKNLEHVIQEDFMPAILGKSFIDDDVRGILCLPARFGGMSMGNVAEYSNREYQNSVEMTAQLALSIVNQESTLNINQGEIDQVKLDIKTAREKFYKEKHQQLLQQLPPSIARQLELISEPGVSCILTSLPLKEYGFAMNKTEFHDYIAFRYNFKISGVSKICGCNQANSINHSLTCKKGGYTILRHNSLAKVLSELMNEAGCYDVVLEPTLQQLTGEVLPSGANTADNARLDVSGRNFWTPLDKVFTDVRIFHAQAPSNAKMSVQQMYVHHENLKKREYNERVMTVEKGSFTPIVFNTTGGIAKEADKFLKRLAEKLAIKRSTPYSKMASFVRKRMRFDLTKTTLIALRGYRGKPSHEAAPLKDLDIHLEKTEGFY